MQRIDIVIPTYNRSHAIVRAYENADENTVEDHTITFVVEADDLESIKVIEDNGYNYLISKYPGTHTGAANTAYEETKEPFFIIANDDFNFHKGWEILALEKMEDGIGVVGVNDGMGNMTPITIVRRQYVKDYGCIDKKDQLYHPGYNHNFVDTETADVAKKRGMWAERPESVVEHLHYTYNKSKKDATYDKSARTSTQDNELYNNRKHLWEAL